MLSRMRAHGEPAFRAKPSDTISNNVMNVGLITDGRPFRSLVADVYWISAVVYRNGIVEKSAVAAGMSNHPKWSSMDGK